MKDKTITHSDIKPCSECNGSGLSNEHDRELPPNYYLCEHCKGTKLEPVRIKLDMPDEWLFSRIEEPYYAVFCYYRWDADEGDDLHFELPHPIGTVLELVCDECGGTGQNVTYYAKKDRTDTRAIRPEDIVCKSCNGNPKKKVKLKDVAVEGNELVEYWECEEIKKMKGLGGSKGEHFKRHTETVYFAIVNGDKLKYETLEGAESFNKVCSIWKETTEVITIKETERVR